MPQQTNLAQAIDLQEIIIFDIADNKKNKLATKFGLAMTKDLESEVNNMCNLSDGIYNKGVIQERNNGIKNLIVSLKKFKIADNDILTSVMEQYHLTRDEALTYMQS